MFTRSYTIIDYGNTNTSNGLSVAIDASSPENALKKYFDKKSSISNKKYDYKFVCENNLFNTEIYPVSKNFVYCEVKSNYLTNYNSEINYGTIQLS